MCSQEPDVCWICLEGGTDDSPLALLCKCPRPVHQQCLARWQLQSVGRKEERICRFCHAELPEWTSAFHLPVAPPAMVVSHNGVQHILLVKPGPQGQLEFQQRVRNIFGLNANDVIDLTFGCKAPGTDQDVALKGWYSYDAAVQCAAFSAGARIASRQTRSNEAMLAASNPGLSMCRHLIPGQTADQLTACPFSNMPRHAQPSLPANLPPVSPNIMHTTEHHAAYQAANQAPAVTMQAANHAAIIQTAARGAHTQARYMPQHSAEVQAVVGTCTQYTLHPIGYAASTQASDSAASSASGFAAHTSDRHRPVMPQPWPEHTANNAATQYGAGLVARTVSTESTAASSSHADLRRGQVVRRGNLMRSTASMVPSLLASFQRHPKRPRHVADRPSSRA